MLYISKVDAEEFKTIPHAAHRHSDSFEMIFEREGNGQISIDKKEYHVKKGDMVIYNCGVLHDERPESNPSLNHFGLTVTNLSLPGLSKNCLIPYTASPIVMCSDYYDIIDQVFSTMYALLRIKRKEAEHICHHSQPVLFVPHILKQPLALFKAYY